MIMKKYSEVRNNLDTGDLIAFGGNGFSSEIIKKATRSNVSHVGVILHSGFGVSLGPDLIMLIESTSLGEGDAGVKINRLSDHDRSYNGDMWILPLKKALREKFSIPIFTRFMLAQVGKPYDMKQALFSGYDILPALKEDFSKMYCSELVAAGYDESGLHEIKNASDVNPIELCLMPLYDETIQIRGEPKGIY